MLKVIYEATFRHHYFVDNILVRFEIYDDDDDDDDDEGDNDDDDHDHDILSFLLRKYINEIILIIIGAANGQYR
uniref:Uncharacterized protein n=1 Tax=Octopus bimaculoides TaxID=37653 RepID=A0A0L8HFT0_OCTBM